ncbi:enolase C-terminal domain-like protein [uncultured Tateyamaria sp.]|uniref:enolase C-terminal domain-like protein n=1 Tax=uncultured Tateyamaria sp. TaxID=455651 RepID=UPI00263087E3|nr:enolase C-terminal domain-like protein [uncultured Tateyamaria sp.]
MRIAGIKARAVMAPLAQPISTAQAVIPAAPLVLVDVETDAGVTGTGYIFAYTPLMLAPLVTFLDGLGETLKGASALPLDVARQTEAQFRLLGRQGLVGMALAGIDLALWDAQGKALGQPVCALLGASPRALPCYDSQGVFVPGRDEHLIAASLDRGFEAIKVKLGFPSVQEDVAALRVVRDMMGPDRDLMLDYNQAFDAPDAIRRIRAIEDAGLDLLWVEEPVAAEDFAAYQTVRAAVSTPLQSGENWWHPADAARALAADTTDYAMPDLIKIGGISGWVQADAMAEAAAVPVSSHLFIEASAHALSATRGAQYLEWLDVAGGLMAEPLALDQGRVAARGPGLGIVWDPDKVAHHAVT